ncbi:hypothetical protein Tco_0685026 [Tanacetum coccineum]
MDDEPMWVADRVVAPTPGSAITIPETANEFTIKGMLNYGKFLKELVSKKHKLKQISSVFLSDESSALIQYKGDLGSFLIPCNFNKAFSCDALADLAKNMLVEVGKFTFPIDFVILEMEEDSKVTLIFGRPFLHRTILEEKLIVEFDEFMAMTTEENSESEFDTEEPPFEKITFNTNYKIKTSLKEPPTDLEHKPLPDNLEYLFLEEPSFLPVIISS